MQIDTSIASHTRLVELYGGSRHPHVLALDQIEADAKDKYRVVRLDCGAYRSPWRSHDHGVIGRLLDRLIELHPEMPQESGNRVAMRELCTYSSYCHLHPPLSERRHDVLYRRAQMLQALVDVLGHKKIRPLLLILDSFEFIDTFSLNVLRDLLQLAERDLSGFRMVVSVQDTAEFKGQKEWESGLSGKEDWRRRIEMPSELEDEPPPISIRGLAGSSVGREYRLLAAWLALNHGPVLLKPILAYPGINRERMDQLLTRLTSDGLIRSRPYAGDRMLDTHGAGGRLLLSVIQSENELGEVANKLIKCFSAEEDESFRLWCQFASGPIVIRQCWRALGNGASLMKALERLETLPHTMHLQLRIAEQLLLRTKQKGWHSRCRRILVEAAFRQWDYRKAFRWLCFAPVAQFADTDLRALLDHIPRLWRLSGRLAEYPAWLDEEMAEMDPRSQGLSYLRLLKVLHHVSAHENTRARDTLRDIEVPEDEELRQQIVACNLLIQMSQERSSARMIDELAAFVRMNEAVLTPSTRGLVLQMMLWHAQTGQVLQALNKHQDLLENWFVDQAIGEPLNRFRARQSRWYLAMGRVRDALIPLEANINEYSDSGDTRRLLIEVNTLVETQHRLKRYGQAAETLARYLDLVCTQEVDGFILDLLLATAEAGHRYCLVDAAARAAERASRIKLKSELHARQIRRRAEAQANAYFQLAMCGGDWGRALESCRTNLEQIRRVGATELEQLHAQIRMDFCSRRLQGHYSTGTPVREYRTQVESIFALEEDLVRFLITMGELALVEEDRTTAVLVYRRLEPFLYKNWGFLVATWQASFQFIYRELRDRSNEMAMQALCLSGIAGLSYYGHYLHLRFPKMRLAPPDRDSLHSSLCLWAETLAGERGKDLRWLRYTGVDLGGGDLQAWYGLELKRLESLPLDFDFEEEQRWQEALEKMRSTLSQWKSIAV